jgi:hypothetical protein
MHLSPRLAVCEAHDLIWLWSGPDAPVGTPPWIDGVSPKLDWTHTAQLGQIWENNAIRLTESFFDVHHFPWVHGSVAPGCGAMVDPYEVTVTDDAQITTQGTLRHEHKSKGIDFRTDMKFPNLQYIEMKGMAFMVCATPIALNRSWVWARFHQNAVPIPLLGKALAWFLTNMDFGILQARQDRPLLDSMQPSLPTPGSDCYVAADKAAATFMRLWRMKLKEASQG